MIRILAALSAGLSAVTIVLVAAEGDLISQGVLLALVAASAGLDAVLVVLTTQTPTEV